MSSENGRTVLVTGAGQACGRAIAEDFAGRGAAVVVNIDESTGRDTVRRIEAVGGTATFVQADVSVDAEVERLIDACISAYGRPDTAINNAGTELLVSIA